MSQRPEWPPTLGAMHSILPAFEFTALVTSNDLGAVFFANQKSLDRRASLGSGTPLYPPGTFASGSRHYLYVSRPVSWNEAVKMAGDGGGHLLVAASAGSAIEDAKNLNPWLGSFGAKFPAVIGGTVSESSADDIDDEEDESIRRFRERFEDGN